MEVLRLTPHFYYTPDVVNGWIVRMDQMGGMQTQIYRQALALAKCGVNQQILPIAMPKAPKVWIPAEGIKVIKGNAPMLPIKSKVRGTVGLNFYWGVGVLWHLLRYKFRKKAFDVIHAHCSGVAAPLIIGALAKIFLKKPLVYTVHCCRVSTYHPMSKLDSLLNKTVINIEKACLKKADHVITLTDRTRSIIQKEYQIADDGISVIPDIIDYDDFISELSDAGIRDFKKRFDIRDKDVTIVFVGRIAYEKGCGVLLDAFAKLEHKECKLIFFGDGNERQMLEQRIKAYGLEKRCFVTGYLPNKEIPFAISSADLMVMPSLHEEFGGLLLEIAAVGKTVIASDAGGIPTIIKDGETGILFTTGDAQQLQIKIDEAITDYETVRYYGEKLRETVREKYSFAEGIEQMAEIYKNLKG